MFLDVFELWANIKTQIFNLVFNNVWHHRRWLRVSPLIHLRPGTTCDEQQSSLIPHTELFCRRIKEMCFHEIWLTPSPSFVLINNKQLREILKYGNMELRFLHLLPSGNRCEEDSGGQGEVFWWDTGVEGRHLWMQSLATVTFNRVVYLSPYLF